VLETKHCSTLRRQAVDGFGYEAVLITVGVL
jgi:hypothetical protein